MDFSEHQVLLKTKSEDAESHKSFEQRFSAQLEKHNSMGSDVNQSSAIASFLLLVNSNVDSAQRIYILAAVTPNDESLSARSSLEDYMKFVDYGTIAAVLPQCQKHDIFLTKSACHTNLSPQAFIQAVMTVILHLMRVLQQ